MKHIANPFGDAQARKGVHTAFFKSEYTVIAYCSLVVERLFSTGLARRIFTCQTSPGKDFLSWSVSFRAGESFTPELDRTCTVLLRLVRCIGRGHEW